MVLCFYSGWVPVSWWGGRLVYLKPLALDGMDPVGMFVRLFQCSDLLPKN